MLGVISNQEWAGQSFREKYGDSIFKTDNQKRLEEYTDQDIDRMRMAATQRLRVSEERAALQTVGVTRATTAPTVEQSHGPSTGRELLARHLRV